MSKPKCEMCNDTGWYGDNGPGIKGNMEYSPCECRAADKTTEDAELAHPRLRKLLAVIHRDDGHYATKHGEGKATEDAISMVLVERARPCQ